MSQSSDEMGDEEPEFMTEEGSGEGDASGEVVDEDTLRILVSTDNHLGYCERDPIRGFDSFAAFEEVLQLAKAHKCDLVLLAGDLFHDNKPSRRTLHKTMEILRRYCMGPDAVKFQIVSDAAKTFRSSINQVVNYEDEFYSVDLPIFSIHGNHDDPTRDGGTESLAALDLLAVSNLVNYFGRSDEVDKVENRPVLIRKGQTAVALYGLGSMRDERLNRMWQKNKVRFLRPTTSSSSNHDNNDDEENADNAIDWFNLFALHQNRDYGRGAKNCVKEEMIPTWMDMVVWGHEHECQIELQESLIGTYRISQPGSSVATSLSPGECERKCVGILDIREKQFRLNPIPLTQVRSFVTSEISLSNPENEEDELDPEDPDIDKRVTELLVRKVEELIADARQKADELLQDALAERVNQNSDYLQELERGMKYKISNPECVLVRLKVEHQGFTTLNNQRFGSRFVKDVANPSDILLFHRKRAETSRKESAAAKAARANLQDPIDPEELEETNVEDLIKDNFENGGDRLELFNQQIFGSAVSEFVEKNTAQAIDEATRIMLKDQQSKLIKRGKSSAEDARITTAAGVREVCQWESQKEREIQEMEEEHAEQKKPVRKKQAESEQNSKKSNGNGWSQSQSTAVTQTRKRKNGNDSDVSDVDIEEFVPAAKRKTIQKTTSRRSKKAITYVESSDDEIEEVEAPPPKRQRAARAGVSKRKANFTQEYDDNDDDIEEVEMPAPPPKKGRRNPAKKTAPGSSGKKKTKQLELSQLSYTSVKSKKKNVAQTSRRAKMLSEYNDSDDSEDDPPASSMASGGWGSKASTHETSRTRGASGRRRRF